ncbi:MAG TPA: TniB family NTP-binding protein [Pyrinomonadaceae bacterium]|jgi:DNA transposition AAA+ family ATPase|nr:TniB family NTP-binding protein [Pyrinomonadaceae bacterium]
MKKKQKSDLRSLTIEQKIALIEQIYIWSPALKEMIDLINRCREFSKIAAEPKSILITGEQGAGKTKLIERYMENFPRAVTAKETIVPVLAVDVINPATVKSLVEELLDALGDPAADKGTIASQTRRLCNLLKKCKTELIIMDEFQHLIDWKSSKVMQNISNWLKVVMNRTKLPIVLIGMPNSADILDTKGNEQLKRRFSARRRLEPFGWGESEDEQADMTGFLENLDEALAQVLPKRSGLDDPETAYLIHSATGGAVHKIMKLVRGAAGMDLNQGLKKIDLVLLEEAYDEYLFEEETYEEHPAEGGSGGEDRQQRVNPFHLAATGQKLPRRKKSSRKAERRGAGDRAMGKRVRASKKGPSVSEILRRQ